MEKFIGDAVMAVFGAPAAHEDDPERAVRAALTIRDAFAEEQATLQLRIGVNTGEALVRLGARPSEGEAMVAGDVVNTAARLQSAAPENGILVGEATFRATDRAIEYRDAAPVQAKGKAEPVPVYEAVAARSRFGVDVPDRMQTPLVGRRREFDVLVDVLERARAGAPQLVTLVGVPGIGKSRLVHELFRIVDADDELIFWRQGRSLPYGTGVTYWALAEMAKAHAGIFESDTAETAAEKLQRVAADLGRDEADAVWLAGHLRPLVGLAGDGATADRREEAVAAWRRLLEAIAEQGPLVLVFEDLHWADDGLLDFVDELVDRAAAVPLLVVCTARPELLERRPGWGGGKRNAVTVSLAPLSDDETALLVSALLERPVLEAEMQAVLLERAGGNPLYAEEFVRMLADRGTAASALPETVQGMIAARLDLLPADEKGLLLDAAVLGKVFWPGALAHVSSLEREAVDELLHRLERKEFVRRDRRSSVAGETELAFLHGLVRDVAYSHLPRAARADRHRRVAAWIELLSADRSEDRAEMLAHHYASALDYAAAAGQPTEELRSRAHDALREAGDRAAALNAFPAAADFYARALELEPEGAESDPDLLVSATRARMMSYEEGEEDALRAADLFVARGDRAGAANALLLAGELRWRRAEAEPASTLFDRAAELVRDEPDSPTKAAVLSSLSRFRMLAGRDEEALRQGREALELAARFDLPHVEAETLNNVGVSRVLLGDEGGLQDLERAVRLAVELATAGVGRGYVNLGSTLAQLGRLERAAALHEEGIAVTRRTGNWGTMRWLKAEMVTDMWFAGRWDDARRLIEAFHEETAETGVPHYMEHAVRLFGALIAAAEGRLDRAVDEAATAVRIAENARDPQAVLPATVLGTFVRVVAGDEAGARERVRTALEQDDRFLYVSWCGASSLWLVERLGLRVELEAAAAGAILQSPWLDAVSAYLADDLSAAAEAYAAMGARPDAAWAHLMAAERLVEAGKSAEAEWYVSNALAFYRSVGATGFLRRAEALLRASA